ncbi:MAG: 30S ribosomal protein S6 [Candidatus Eisenbacteria bacterium]|jgi:small subunit ribosomal protein S6
MREYETVFILDPTLDENQVKEETDKVKTLITSLGGEVTSAEPPIRKRLPYEIGGKTEGYYALIIFRTEPTTIAEMERAYRLNERVLRHIVVVSAKKPAVPEESKEARA